MAKTSLGIPLFAESTLPDGPAQMGAQAQAVDGLFLSRTVPLAVNYRTRTSTVDNLDNRSGGLHIASYDGPITYVAGGGVTFSGGTWTVHDDGLYAWSADWSFPPDTTAGSVNVWAEVNGAHSVYGQNEVTLTSGHRTNITAGGPIVLSNGDTLMMVGSYLNAGTLTGCRVDSACVRRVG